jgi:hypothetical protein
MRKRPARERGITKIDKIWDQQGLVGWEDLVEEIFGRQRSGRGER